MEEHNSKSQTGKYLRMGAGGGKARRVHIGAFTDKREGRRYLKATSHFYSSSTFNLWVGQETGPTNEE